MGLDHVMVLRVVDGLADLRAKDGDLAGARAPYEEMYAAVVERKGEHHLLAIDVAFLYGHFLHRQKLHDDAIPWLNKVLQASDGKSPESIRERCKAHYFLALAHEKKDASKVVHHLHAARNTFDSLPADRELQSFSSRALLSCRLIIALEKAGGFAELAAEVADFEKTSLQGVAQADEMREIVTSIKGRLPARLADETIRSVLCFAQPRSGSPLESLAAAGGLAMSGKFALFESVPARQLTAMLDDTKSLTARSPIDDVGKRPVEIVLVTFKKGERYQIDLMSKNVDPLLTLRDASGRELAKNDDRAKGTLDSRIVWTCPADGAYQVVAGTYGTKRLGDVRLTIHKLTETPSLRVITRPR